MLTDAQQRHLQAVQQTLAHLGWTVNQHGLVNGDAMLIPVRWGADGNATWWACCIGECCEIGTSMHRAMQAASDKLSDDAAALLVLRSWCAEQAREVVNG